MYVVLGIPLYVGLWRLPQPWQKLLFLALELAVAGAVVMAAVAGWKSLRQPWTGESEAAFRRRQRNAAIGWAVFGLVVLFFLATQANFSKR